MDRYDEEINSLRSQLARAEQLRARLGSLYAQWDELSKREAELRSRLEDEEDDVRRLECRSLARWFYGLTGGLEDRLSQERAEARAAAVKHDAVARELNDVSASIDAAATELEALSGCEDLYNAAIERKAEAMKVSGSAAGERLAALEREAASVERGRREIEEAIRAGRHAQHAALEIIDSLSRASTWGTVDFFTDSFLVDVVKYGHLDEAQARIEDLQVRLRRFGTELRDVGEYGGALELDIGGFLQFADYFFDGLFVDFAVNQRIENSLAQARAVSSRIDAALRRLDGMLADCDKARRRLDEEYESLVTQGLSVRELEA